MKLSRHFYFIARHGVFKKKKLNLVTTDTSIMVRLAKCEENIKYNINKLKKQTSTQILY